jgi:hypothetical protein
MKDGVSFMSWRNQKTIRASAPPMKLKRKGELWVIQATPGAPKVSSEQIKAMIDALD